MNKSEALYKIGGWVFANIPNVFYNEISYRGDITLLTMLLALHYLQGPIKSEMEKYRYET